MRRVNFEVERSGSKLMGVCAGLANTIGLDATIIRIGFVVATVVGGWPWTVVAYFVLALAGQPKRGRIHGSRSGSLSGSGHAGGGYDRRLAEIDNYVADSNGRLAREIEDLR